MDSPSTHFIRTGLPVKTKERLHQKSLCIILSSIEWNVLSFITAILKSLVVPVIWLALINAIYSRIAPFFALNRIFFPANEEATLKTKQPIRFQGLFKATDQTTGKLKIKSIMWQILQLLSLKLLLFPPKLDEFNFRPAQYECCINKIFDLIKSCIWMISKWME